MVLVIAHRGYSGKYPENTLLAIRKAVELGVDWIEIDVHLSRDCRVVVIHDIDLDRTTTGKGRVASKTFEEIRKYRTKRGRHQIPVLEEVFPLLKKGTVLNIELKSMWVAGPVAELIKKYNVEEKVIVSSVSINALNIIKRKMPSIRTAFVFYTSNYSKWGYFVTFLSKLSFPLTHFYVSTVAQSLKVDYVHLSYPFATKKFIKKLHKRGLRVNVWTVNTKALMKQLIKHKADGIMTNYPDVLKKIVS